MIFKCRASLLIILAALLVAPKLNIFAQDIVSDLSSEVTLGDNEDIFTETIKIISNSQRIFIISNTNQQLNKGDFITLILNQKEPVARAIVAKNYNGLSGIKVLKIYSLSNWGKIQKDLDVDILKGDDSSLFRKKAEVVENTEESKIKSEDDLYSEELIDEDLNSFGKDNRLIKPDNIVGASWARYQVENTALDNEVSNHSEIGASWAYQIRDNVWIEGLYSRVFMKDIPAKGIETSIDNLTIRAKYVFKLPLYSYALPYVGFVYSLVSSPEAGKSNDSTLTPPQNTAINDAENELIDELARQDFIFGVTLLRRLVPGWFLRADIGTDKISIGAAVEF